MIKIRDYQKDLLERMHGALANRPAPRIMLQLPTGGGKTCIAGELLSDLLKDGRKAVWLTHRKELAAQTEGMLREAGVPATSSILWTPRTQAPTIANGVVILMAQTVSRRTAKANVWDSYDRSDLMIIDEAHHATADGWARAINQWPGPVIGMTATPWRLSQKEGFDHLFGELHCGPQVADLQSDGWLCRARILAPPEGEQMEGGQVEYTGDYSEAGIESANEDRDIWTAGALRFWQAHAADRQTVVYAVSVRHARNLVAVFNDAGTPAGLMLGDTPTEERAKLIDQFQDGTLKALINVVVATEGFDLPDASCVVLTRPTMSVALYLQMVGRGLRPKPYGGDCVILDLAGNGLRHGLPEEEREWSLEPRSRRNEDGAPPVVRCPHCECLSPASNHHCGDCGAPFGETCGRCGAWRVWERWSWKTGCGEDHDPVCDLCHYDAHVQARLPVTEELKGLAQMTNDDELSPHRDPFLKKILEEERRRVGGADEERRRELRSYIGTRESELADDNELTKLFENHVAALAVENRPLTEPQKYRLYNEWEGDRRRRLADWKDELAKLDAQPIDGQLILNNVRDRLIQLLEAEAREAGLITKPRPQGRPSQHAVEEYHSPDSLVSGEWMTFIQLREWAKEKPGNSPLSLRDPRGKEISVSNWVDLLVETADWLIGEGLLTKENCPVTLGRMTKRYLIHATSYHPTGRKFGFIKQLSNGLYLEGQWDPPNIARRCQELVSKFDQDPKRFRVRLR